MTKHLPLIFIVIIIVGGGFIKAEEPPYYLLMHDDARLMLDSLEQHPTDSNAFERMVLLHNLGFNKDKQSREKAEIIFEENFKKDKTPIIQAYGNSLKMLKVRDRNMAGNTWRYTKTFFGLFGDDPYEEARKAFDGIQESIKKDSNNIQLRILSLSSAVESAEYLDGLLGYASRDLLWLRNRTDQLDSTETFFYALSWAKYAYKYALIKEIPSEAKKGYIWITYAETYALSEVYCDEACIWWIKIDSLVKEK